MESLGSRITLSNKSFRSNNVQIDYVKKLTLNKITETKMWITTFSLSTTYVKQNINEARIRNLVSRK